MNIHVNKEMKKEPKKVTALIMIRDRKVLVAQRGGDDPLAHYWEFPGGKIEECETPEECLKREIQEELEIDITVGEPFGESQYNYEKGSILLLAYYGYWQSGKIALKVHENYLWATRNDLRQIKFAPADIPFVERLLHSESILEG